MSVIKFGKELFGKLCADILYSQERDRWTFLWRDADKDQFYTSKKYMTKDQKEHSIKCWVDRLFIGNQLAWAYTYNEELTLERLGDRDFGVWGFQNGMKFYSELKSLRYNLFTNGGNSFVSAGDMKKLNDLISTLQTIIIYGREKK